MQWKHRWIDTREEKKGDDSERAMESDSGAIVRRKLEKKHRSTINDEDFSVDDSV